MAGYHKISRESQSLVLTMDKPMRSFIAADIPDIAKQAIGDALASFKKENPEISWVGSSNLHLTLKFLGAVDPPRLGALKEKLSDVLKNEKSFFINLSGTGAFPDFEIPQILWIGVASGEEFLRNLADKVNIAAYMIGFEKDVKPFSAHLTIGRVKKDKKIQSSIEQLKGLKFELTAPMCVDHVTLYKSTLTSSGPLYEPIEKIAFA